MECSGGRPKVASPCHLFGSAEETDGLGQVVVTQERSGKCDEGTFGDERNTIRGVLLTRCAW